MITILGATGNVGGKLAYFLKRKTEKIRLVARSADKLKKYIGRNAEAFPGDMQSVEFLTDAFMGADAVFAMIPTNPFAEDVLGYSNMIGESIARSIEISKVKYLVNLSSIGAELAEGTGPIRGVHDQEERLNRITGLNVLHLRAAYFMENLLMSISLIRSRRFLGTAIKEDIKFPLVATKDIAAYAAERLVKRDFFGSSIAYVLGPEDLSMKDATTILGKKIGKPKLSYEMFSYEEAEKDFISAGFSPDATRLYIEMSKAFNEGKITGPLERTKESSTPTTFEAFCDEVFAPAYFLGKAA